MSLLELQQPGQFTGIRLKRLEVRNWGTFDKHIFSLDYQGRSSLLVGGNGSGKTTLSDALLTLLVEKKKRNYNVSASQFGKKRGRNELSYVRGDFKDMNSDGGFRSQKVSLRNKDGTLSILLGVFENYNTGESLTIAQVIYLSGKDNTVPVYCYSEKDRTIKEILDQISSLKSIKKDLKRIGFVICNPIRTYYDKIREWTGIRPNALDVFNQTVAVKEIPDLNGFIRSYMLDSTDYQSHISSILSHYDDLQRSYEKISHAAEQIAELEPIAKEGQAYKENTIKLEAEKSKLETHRYFFAKKAHEVFSKALEEARSEKQSLESQRDTLQAKIDLDESQRISLEAEKQTKGGYLKNLQDQLKSFKEELEEIRSQRSDFVRSLAMLKLEIKPDSESNLKKILSTIRALHSTAEARLNELFDKLHDCKNAITSNQTTIAHCSSQLSDLKERPSNIPKDLNELRVKIADEIGLKPTQLPFVAELIQVKDAEQEWKPTIEKVLRPFGMTLLVPDSRHAEVIRYAEANKLTDKKDKGMLLTFEKVYENDSFGMEKVDSDSRTIAGKLDFKISHPFGRWARREVTSRFQIRCFENIDEFRKYGGEACTIEGQIRNAKGRIRKDDREKSNDPLNYILGWDNEEKRENLIQEQQRASILLERNNKNYDALADSKSYWENVRLHSPSILKIKSWDEIDDTSVREQIKETKTSISSHLAKNHSIAELENQIVAINKKNKDREADKTRLSERIGALNNSIESYSTSVQTSNLQLKDLPEPAAKDLAAIAEDLRHRYLLTAKSIYGSKGSKGDYAKSREFIDGEIKELERALNKAIQSIERKMGRFLERFKADGFDERMEGSIDYLAQFEEVHKEIAQDRLYKFKEDFRKIAQNHVQNDLAQFNQVLRRASKQIDERIDEISDALKDIEFNRGTYIKLINRPSKNEQGLKLNRSLEDALSGTIGRQGTFEEAEAFFKSLQPLLENLSDQEWVSNACDVRLWHHFFASERNRSDDQERQGHSSTDTDSGGEKVKLAFTILVAAIVYQYNIDTTNPKAPTFRFVLIDEAFARVDDKFATYTLNLLERFDIQLIVVAPLDPKARIVESYVDYFVMTEKKTCEDDKDRSVLHILEKKEFQERAANAPRTDTSEAQSA